MVFTREGWLGIVIIISIPVITATLYFARSITNLQSFVEEVLVFVLGTMAIVGVGLIYRGLKPNESLEHEKVFFNPMFKHIEARLFYSPKRRWEETRVIEKHWWEIRKQKPSRSKLVLVKDLKKAYYVGTYAWNLIIERKIEWFAEDDQNIEEWCKREGYKLIKQNASEDNLLEPFFDAKISDKKAQYRQGEAVFFETIYRGKLTNGFFDNEITPLSGQILPNRRPSYWCWDPDTLPNPNSGGKLEDYVTHTSNWDWSIPQDAPLGQYRVIMGIHNHFDMQTRPRIAHKEETITIISRSGKQGKSIAISAQSQTLKDVTGTLAEVYSPIHAMIVRVNGEIPRETALRGTVGGWVSASLMDFGIISAVFNQHNDKLRNRDLEMWLEIEKEIKKGQGFFLGQDRQKWFDELEAEYNRLTKRYKG